MTTRETRREAAIERMADHVLAEGLSGATLRPLAAAVGTSDRMLLYYFADKDELLTLVLQRIAARLTAKLDASIPAGTPQSFAALLEQVWGVLGSEALKPFMHVWLDLMAGAARGVQPHRDIAGSLADGYLAWVASHLAVGDATRPATAALFLAVVEGMYLLEALGRPAMAQDAKCAIVSGDF